jgi:hypothetical protein
MDSLFYLSKPLANEFAVFSPNKKTRKLAGLFIHL